MRWRIFFGASYLFEFGLGDAIISIRCVLQRHLLELRLPRGSKDAPDTFIVLIVTTIKLLSGKLLSSLFRDSDNSLFLIINETEAYYVAFH